MMRQARKLALAATVVMAAAGLIEFFASYGTGRVELARGIAFGAVIAILEFDSTAIVLAILLWKKSKLFWGVLLAGKSLLVLGLVAGGIMVLKISGLGFIIGFSGLLPGVVIGSVFMKSYKEAG